MKFFLLPRYAKARVWFGGAVPAFSPSGAVRTVVEGTPNALVASSHVTVEALVPMGGMASYGLLGMRFDATTDLVLRVEVPYSHGAGLSWSESLVASIDDVRLGLMREHAQTILDAAAGHVARRFPPGAIRVVEAAEGQVGSNARLFERLATCVLDLMHDERSDEETASLLASRLLAAD